MLSGHLGVFGEIKIWANTPKIIKSIINFLNVKYTKLPKKRNLLCQDSSKMLFLTTLYHFIVPLFGLSKCYFFLRTWDYNIQCIDVFSMFWLLLSKPPIVCLLELTSLNGERHKGYHFKKYTFRLQIKCCYLYYDKSFTLFFL